MAENADIFVDPVLGGKWKSWCRLCAKANAQYVNVVAGEPEELMNESIFKCHRDLANVILEFFRIHIKEDDKLPQIICEECHEVVLSLIKFSERANKVQQMYDDLQKAINKSTANLQILLESYGINPFKDEIMIPQNAMELPVEEIFVADFVEADIPMPAPLADVKNEKVSKIENQEEAIAKDNKEMEIDDPFGGDDERDIDYESSSSEDGSSSSSEDSSDKKKSLSKLKEKKVTKLKDRKNLSTFKDRPKRKSVVKSAILKSMEKPENETCKLFCNNCSEKFKRRSNYTRHMKQKHGLLNCRRCTSTFESEADLKQHMKEQHGKSWNCPHCEQTFLRKGLRSNHIRMEHSANMKIKTYKITNINHSFTCEVCGQVFPQKKQRKQHMLAQHPNYEPNVCKICGRIFKEKSSLKKHLERHGDKFMCTECGKQLTCNASLTSHMLVHSDLTPHKCDVCGRAFKRPKALKYHLIAHTGLRPYACDFCEKTFSTGSSCRLHKKTMHPNELAALEASGAVQYTKNVPKLAELRAVARTGTNFRPLMSKQNGYAPRTSILPQDETTK
ncbi:zinc finger protein weckle-like [Eurosta solidaginis]|uniref:zinc finger protein weckle-like n=1 Tax=Eurosta solidaginis TaxID=178769 RepID=UPI003530AF29